MTKTTGMIRITKVTGMTGVTETTVKARMPGMTGILG